MAGYLNDATLLYMDRLLDWDAFYSLSKGEDVDVDAERVARPLALRGPLRVAVHGVRRSAVGVGHGRVEPQQPDVPGHGADQQEGCHHRRRAGAALPGDRSRERALGIQTPDGHQLPIAMA